MRYILFLDDQPWWESMLTDAIRNGHLPECTVHHAATSGQAMDLIEKYQFNVALLDYRLGLAGIEDTATGLEVACALRARQPGVPIYIVTMMREYQLLPACEPLRARIIEKRRSDLSNAIVEAIREALAEYDAAQDLPVDGPAPV